MGMKTKQYDRRECDDRNLKILRPDCYGSLAVLVREISAQHRKQNERCGKKHADPQNQVVFLFGSEVERQNQVNNEILQPVLIERALELRNDQAPESKAPA